MTNWIAVFLYCPHAQIIVPHKAQTEAGFYLEVEPVEVGSLEDTETVKDILERARKRPWNRIPTPPRSGSSVRDVPSMKASNARSYSDFVRSVLHWHIEQLNDASYQIQRMISPPRENYFVGDPGSRLLFPAETPRAQLFAKFVEVVKAARASDC